jgi:hypothetical protein
MNEHRDNFEKWFGAVLEHLMRDRNAGFVVVVATFPLLERYLVQKALSEANSKPFNEALLAVFPNSVRPKLRTCSGLSFVMVCFTRWRLRRPTIVSAMTWKSFSGTQTTISG